jgi:hypothetical protein
MKSKLLLCLALVLSDQTNSLLIQNCIANDRIFKI